MSMPLRTLRHDCGGADAGDLDQWQATPEELTNPEFGVWNWLRQPPPKLPVFIGYGSDEWPVWQHLWEHFLDLGHITTLS
jgi:hypothetical protein